MQPIWDVASSVEYIVITSTKNTVKIKWHMKFIDELQIQLYPTYRGHTQRRKLVNILFYRRQFDGFTTKLKFPSNFVDQSLPPNSLTFPSRCSTIGTPFQCRLPSISCNNILLKINNSFQRRYCVRCGLSILEISRHQLIHPQHL